MGEPKFLMGYTGVIAILVVASLFVIFPFYLDFRQRRRERRQASDAKIRWDASQKP